MGWKGKGRVRVRNGKWRIEGIEGTIIRKGREGKSGREWLGKGGGVRKEGF